MRKSNVDLHNAKEGEYRELLKKIQASESGCGFCPDNFPACHKYPILHRIGAWQITLNAWPYANTRFHFLIIYEKHTDDIRSLTPDDWRDLGTSFQWILNNYEIPGGGFAMRFGDPRHSGASVNGHLHAGLICPDIDAPPPAERPISDKEFADHPNAAWFRIG